MDATSIFNFLMISGAIQGFVFNIATLLSRKKIERLVLFLNLFVLFLSLNNLQSWWVDKGLIPDNFFLQHFLVPWYILIVPMFYVFLIFYLGIEKKRWSFLLFSGIFFLLAVLIRSLVIFLAFKDIIPIEDILKYNLGEDVVALSYSLFLFIKAYRLVSKHQVLFQPILAFDDLIWVKRFMFFGGGVFVLWIMAIFFNFTGLVKAPFSYYPLRLGSSLLIYWVGYQAFFRYVVLKDRIMLRKEIRNETHSVDNDKTKEIRLSKRIEKEGKTFEAIDEFIRTNQRFLDPYLSLENVSDEVGMSISSISKLMNSYAGSNFSDYINNFRVTEAKKLLADKSFSPYTIVAIGLECGFNSKSTFYAAFKKFTGQTPTQYRKSFHG